MLTLLLVKKKKKETKKKKKRPVVDGLVQGVLGRFVRLT